MHKAARSAIAIVLTLVLSAAVAAAETAPDRFGTAWKPLRIGAGGYLTGMDISPDGSTRIVRADTYGAYIWNAARAQWDQLVTASSMPKPLLNRDYAAGVYEIRMAPSLPARLYMAFAGSIFRSDDRGAHWSKTSFHKVAMEPNDANRTNGQKLAVDPANPDVVLAGTQQDGLFATRDGGASWQKIAPVPVSQKDKDGLFQGITGIAFDPASGTLAGRTKIIYASSYGNGVFISSDAGQTWSAQVGGPKNIGHGKIAADGTYFATGDDHTAVWRYAAGQWKNITPEAQNWDTVVLDPDHAERLLAIREGGFIDISRDQGEHWDGIIWGQGHNVRIAKDIPWLAWTKGEYMAGGDLLFDPVVKGRLWFAEGLGVWYSDFDFSHVWNVPVEFTSQSLGIEQLVANEIVAPPGGRPLVASWDRPVFRSEDSAVFPTEHGPNRENDIVAGWAIDYAGTQPNFIAGVFDWWGREESSYSRDGGQTWEKFASYPALDGAIGGDIAVSTPDNMIWAASNKKPAFVTKDGGQSWSPLKLYEPMGDDPVWSFAYYLNRHIVAADRVKPGRFYLYHSVNGLYRTEDGGTTWTLAHKGEIVGFSSYNAKLRSVPGKAGHLFFTAGRLDGVEPVNSPFMRSTDGGPTWKAVANVREVLSFGFGKPRAGAEYPAIFIAGWVSGAYGIWRSDDNASTWKQIGEFPNGNLDTIKAVEGDKDTFGRVYLGFQGSGYAVGDSP